MPTSQPVKEEFQKTSQAALFGPGAGGLWCVIVLVSVAVTLIALQFSWREGRLLTDPQYNDSAYLADAARYAVKFYEGGAPAVFARYAESPPHSPYSVAVAFFGFLALGIHDWVPYAFNFFLLVGLCAVTALFLEKFGRTAQIAGVVILSATPAAFGAIHEFQPDVPTALFILLAAAIWLRMAVCGPTAVSAVCAGFASGLAVISKTPFFPYSIALGGTAFVLFFVGRWFIASERPTLSGAARWAGLGLLGFLVPAFPHYLFAWRNVLNYIQQNLVGSKSSVWAQSGTLLDQFLFHVTGPSGSMFLVPIAGLVIGGIAFGLVGSLASLKRRHLVFVFVFLLAFTCISYAGIAVNHMRNVSFGQTFQLSATITALAGYAIGIGSVRARLGGAARKLLPLFVWAAIACLVVLNYAPPGDFRYRGDRSLDIIEWQQSIPKQVLRAIRAGAAKTDGSLIYFACNSFASKVNAHTVDFLATQADVRSREGRFFDYYSLTNEPLDDLARNFRNAAFVFVADPDAFGMSPPEIPLNEKGAEIMALLDSDPAFEKYAHFDSPGGGKYHLYRRHESPQFHGWTRMRGVYPLEGPFPELKLPQIRWISFPKAVLECDSDQDQNVFLQLEVRNNAKDQVLTVAANDKNPVACAIPSSPELTAHRIPVKLSKGLNRIELQFSRSDPAFPGSRSLLASQIKLDQGESLQP